MFMVPSYSKDLTRAMHNYALTALATFSVPETNDGKFGEKSFYTRFGCLETFHSRDALSAVFLFNWAFLQFIRFRECKKQTTMATETSTMAV